MNLLRRLTTPPRFEDEAEARSANLLSSILRLLFVVMGLFFVLSLILNTGQGYGYYVIFLLVIGITYAQIRQGQVQRATYFFATMIWLGSTVVGLAFNRVDSTGRVAFMLAILICGAILKGRSQVIAFLAVFASALGTYFLNRLDLLSSLPPPLNMNPDINQFLILAFAAFVLYLVARILGEAIYRARSNEEATRAILDDLVHTSISQSYLNNILRSLTDTLIVLDPAHKIERVNQASLDLLGYSEADLIGQPLSKILSSHALERLAGSSDKALTSVETAYLARDGRGFRSRFPVRCSMTMMAARRGSSAWPRTSASARRRPINCASAKNSTAPWPGICPAWM